MERDIDDEVLDNLRKIQVCLHQNLSSQNERFSDYLLNFLSNPDRITRSKTLEVLNKLLWHYIDRLDLGEQVENCLVEIFECYSDLEENISDVIFHCGLPILHVALASGAPRKMRMHFLHFFSNFFACAPRNVRIRVCKEIRANQDDIPSLLRYLISCGDFSTQLEILDILVRIKGYMDKNDTAGWFVNPQLRSLFYNIKDFEPDAQNFLNKLNENQGSSRLVTSHPVSSCSFASRRLHKPAELQQFWVDFSLRSGNIHFFYILDEETEDGPWNSLIIERTSVTRVEIEKNGTSLSLTFRVELTPAMEESFNIKEKETVLEILLDGAPTIEKTLREMFPNKVKLVERRMSQINGLGIVTNTVLIPTPKKDALTNKNIRGDESLSFTEASSDENEESFTCAQKNSFPEVIPDQPSSSTPTDGHQTNLAAGPCKVLEMSITNDRSTMKISTMSLDELYPSPKLVDKVSSFLDLMVHNEDMTVSSATKSTKRKSESSECCASTTNVSCPMKEIIPKKISKAQGNLTTGKQSSPNQRSGKKPKCSVMKNLSGSKWNALSSCSSVQQNDRHGTLPDCNGDSPRPTQNYDLATSIFISPSKRTKSGGRIRANRHAGVGKYAHKNLIRRALDFQEMDLCTTSHGQTVNVDANCLGSQNLDEDDEYIGGSYQIAEVCGYDLSQTESHVSDQHQIEARSDEASEGSSMASQRSETSDTKNDHQPLNRGPFLEKKDRSFETSDIEDIDMASQNSLKPKHEFRPSKTAPLFEIKELSFETSDIEEEKIAASQKCKKADLQGKGTFLKDKNVSKIEVENPTKKNEPSTQKYKRKPLQKKKKEVSVETSNIEEDYTAPLKKNDTPAQKYEHIPLQKKKKDADTPPLDNKPGKKYRCKPLKVDISKLVVKSRNKKALDIRKPREIKVESSKSISTDIQEVTFDLTDQCNELDDLFETSSIESNMLEVVAKDSDDDYANQNLKTSNMSPSQKRKSRKSVKKQCKNIDVMQDAPQQIPRKSTINEEEARSMGLFNDEAYVTEEDSVLGEKSSQVDLNFPDDHVKDKGDKTTQDDVEGCSKSELGNPGRKRSSDWLEAIFNDKRTKRDLSVMATSPTNTNKKHDNDSLDVDKVNLNDATELHEGEMGENSEPEENTTAKKLNENSVEEEVGKDFMKEITNSPGHESSNVNVEHDKVEHDNVEQRTLETVEHGNVVNDASVYTDPERNKMSAERSVEKNYDSPKDNPPKEASNIVRDKASDKIKEPGTNQFQSNLLNNGTNPSLTMKRRSNKTYLNLIDDWISTSPDSGQKSPILVSAKKDKGRKKILYPLNNKILEESASPEEEISVSKDRRDSVVRCKSVEKAPLKVPSFDDVHQSCTKNNKFFKNKGKASGPLKKVPRGQAKQRKGKDVSVFDFDENDSEPGRTRKSIARKVKKPDQKYNRFLDEESPEISSPSEDECELICSWNNPVIGSIKRKRSQKGGIHAGRGGDQNSNSRLTADFEVLRKKQHSTALNVSSLSDVISSGRAENNLSDISVYVDSATLVDSDAKTQKSSELVLNIAFECIRYTLQKKEAEDENLQGLLQKIEKCVEKLHSLNRGSLET